MDLQALIRDIPDFPQPGIVFKDITPLLKDGAGLAAAVEAMAAPWLSEGIDAVLAVEARGYLLGTPVALRLGTGFVPARKPGKLPYETVSVDYQLEYGTDTIEMHRDGVETGQRVLIVDDILATGAPSPPPSAWWRAPAPKWRGSPCSRSLASSTAGSGCGATGWKP